MTPSHFGAAHHLAAAVHAHHVAHHSTGTTSSTTTAASGITTVASSTTTGSGTTTSAGTGCTSTGSSTTTAEGAEHAHHTGSSSTNTALTTAIQTLRNDIQTIELASNTTVGQLTAIRAAFQTISSDGLTPSSRSALWSFEDSLVTANASRTTLAGNATLLSQFEALYTSSPTAQQTADLTTAYNALAAAVTSAGITSGNISTINADWSAVVAAANSSSTATFPYFSLVAGEGGGLCH